MGAGSEGGGKGGREGRKEGGREGLRGGREGLRGGRGWEEGRREGLVGGREGYWMKGVVYMLANKLVAHSEQLKWLQCANFVDKQNGWLVVCSQGEGSLPCLERVFAQR